MSAGRNRRRTLRKRTKRVRRRILAWAARAALAVVRPLPFVFTRRAFPLLTRVLAYPLLRRRIDAHLRLAYGDALASPERRRIAKQVDSVSDLPTGSSRILLIRRVPS